MVDLEITVTAYDISEIKMSTRKGVLTFGDEMVHKRDGCRVPAEHVIPARAHTLNRHAQAGEDMIRLPQLGREGSITLKESRIDKN